MKILFVGASSSLGLALKPLLAEFAEVVTAGRKGCDVQLDLTGNGEAVHIGPGFDTVINAAAHTGGKSAEQMLNCENVNVLGALKLCRACTKASVGHLVQVSSIFAKLDAASPFHNAYALSKRHADEATALYSANFGLPLLTIRPAQLYGVGEAYRRNQPFLYSIMDKAQQHQDIVVYGSNDAQRNFIHVEDVAMAIALAVRRKLVGTYECVYPENVRYSQIADAAIEAFGSRSRVSFAPEQPNIPDNAFAPNDALYRAVDYFPWISMLAGMREGSGPQKRGGMKTILVSGASGIVGYGTLRSLKASGLDLRLVGTSIYGDSVAPGFCDIFVQAPPTPDHGYMAWLFDTMAQHQVDMLIPGIEIDLYQWVEHLPEFAQRGAKVLMNDVPLIRLCKDKWAFFENLRAAGMACAIDSTLDPSFETLRARFGLPFLLKPRQGFGSQGIVRIDSEAGFMQHRHAMGNSLLAQPIVGTNDEEYTSSAFCDGKGSFYACMTLRRKLSKDGFTEKAEVVDNTEFLDTIHALCRHFRPVGPTNFQFRKCADGIKLLEINPRISSSTSIRTAFGYNESAMAVEYFLHHKIPIQPEIRRGKAVRYTDDFIFYENSIHL